MSSLAKYVPTLVENVDFNTRCVANIGTHTVRDRALLLKCGGDEEGVRLGVFVLSDLNADLWDADTDLIQEPQQSVVVYHVCGGRNLLTFAGKGERKKSKH